MSRFPDSEVQAVTIILNRAKCLKCNDVIISYSRHDLRSCKCGSLTADGGRDYTKRLFNHIHEFEEQSIYSDAEFSIIRENLYRGSRGLDGLQPLTYIKLSEINDQYLDNIIAYQEKHGYTDSIDYKFQVKEREYRGYLNRG